MTLRRQAAVTVQRCLSAAVGYPPSDDEAQGRLLADLAAQIAADIDPPPGQRASCPSCGTEGSGRRHGHRPDGRQRWKCDACGKRFTQLVDTAGRWIRSHGDRLPALLQCLADGAPLREIATACEVSVEIASRLRRLVTDRLLMLGGALGVVQDPGDAVLYCPRCGGIGTGSPCGTEPIKGLQRYRCRVCGRNFTETSVVEVAPPVQIRRWMKLLRNIAAGRTIKRTALDCGVGEGVVRLQRKRLMEAMLAGMAAQPARRAAGGRGTAPSTGPSVACPYCDATAGVQRYGHLPDGRQRWKCTTCGRGFSAGTIDTISNEWRLRKIAATLLQRLKRKESFAEAMLVCGIDLAILLTGKRRDSQEQ